MRLFLILSLLALSVPAYSGRLFLLAAGDTADPVLGRSASRDLAAVEAFFRTVAQITGLSYRTAIIRDREQTWNRWDTALQGFTPGENDVLVVYFSTDGRKSPQNAWPDLMMESQGKNIYLLTEELKKKKAGLLVVVAETPQRESPEARSRSSLVPGAPVTAYRGLYDLFLKSKGTVLMAASESGESALSFSEGGALTVTLLETMNRNFSKAIPLTWAGILKEVAALVKEDTGGAQNPMVLQDIRMSPPAKAGPLPTLP